MVRSLMNRSERSLAPMAPLSRVFEQFFDEPLLTLMPVQGPGTQQGFALDLSEDEQNIIVRAALPGFNQEEVNVELDDGVLTISAQHSEDKEEGSENERFYRRERRFGSVQRRIAVPVPVREDDAMADLKDGVLTLKLPKIQKAPARRISIGKSEGQTMREPQGRPQQGRQTPGSTPGSRPTQNA